MIIFVYLCGEGSFSECVTNQEQIMMNAMFLMKRVLILSTSLLVLVSSSCSKSEVPISIAEKKSSGNSLSLYSLYSDIRSGIKAQMTRPLLENELRSLSSINLSEQSESIGKSYETVITEAGLTPTTEQFFLLLPAWVLDGVELPSTHTISLLDIPEEEKLKIVSAIATIDAYQEIYESEGVLMSSEGFGLNKKLSPHEKYDKQIEACFGSYVKSLIEAVGDAAATSAITALFTGPKGMAVGFLVSGVYSIMKARNAFKECMSAAKMELNAELEARKNGGCSIIWFPPKEGDVVVYDNSMGWVSSRL